MNKHVKLESQPVIETATKGEDRKLETRCAHYRNREVSIIVASVGPLMTMLSSFLYAPTWSQGVLTGFLSLITLVVAPVLLVCLFCECMDETCSGVWHNDMEEINTSFSKTWRICLITIHATTGVICVVLLWNTSLTSRVLSSLWVSIDVLIFAWILFDIHTTPRRSP